MATDFTYEAPGHLIPGSGMKGNGGRANYTVYSRIRFPIAEGPSFANSQSFMNWGDCDQTGRVLGIGDPFQQMQKANLACAARVTGIEVDAHARESDQLQQPTAMHRGRAIARSIAALLHIRFPLG